MVIVDWVQVRVGLQREINWSNEELAGLHDVAEAQADGWESNVLQQWQDAVQRIERHIFELKKKLKATYEHQD